MQLCNDCPRHCNAVRDKFRGFCGVGSLPRVARAGLHFGEEPPISGKNGSGTVFFSGCSLKCVFCQNFNISHKKYGKDISVERLAEIFRELEASGAHNINLVTPTHYISAIKEALKIYRPGIPIVYNSSGYDDIKVIEEDIFDIYLFDLKFISRDKSKRYAACENYFDIASEVIKKAYSIKGEPIFDENGIMQRGVVVRHLILPQSTNDAISIINWLYENTPQICLSIMSQYVPMYKAEYFKEINRPITKREYEKVLSAAFDKNFTEVYTQQMSSATTEFIPKFDLTGI